MAHNFTHRRRLAPPDPQPNVKRQSYPSIISISNNFSRLNPNPTPDNSPKYPPPEKLIDTHLQAKTLSKPAVIESSKRVVLESGKEVKNEGKNELVVSGVEKKRSFCDVKEELDDFLVTNSAKVMSADMPPFIQIHAIGFARKVKDSLEKFTSKNLALSLKKEFDGVYGPAWHCIVGSSFGSFVTHSVGGFLYFSLDQKLYVLLFKTTVQRAD